MIVESTPFTGLHLVTPALRSDERGSFGRTWDPDIAKTQGLLEHFDYTCISTNTAIHTLRGMHYQQDPHSEIKLVRCTKGAIFDVVIDIRPDSPTFKQWYGAELTAENHAALYIPQGFAHGFMTLMADSEVLYYLKYPYVAQAATGVRWNDPAFSIKWPASPTMIAERDAAYPDFIS